MRLLFVCGRNRLRSPTAERIFADAGHETESAGVNPDAEQTPTPDLIEWADIVFVMEEAHRRKLSRMGLPLRGKKIVCLGIADEYGFMDPAQIRRGASLPRRFPRRWRRKR